MQSNDIIKVLENEEAQSFIRSHINDDVASLALKYAQNRTFNMAVCLQLIKLYKKSQKKLPIFYDHLLAIDDRSYAQCTSEAVARYKSTFLSGDSMLDLTAGVGVDSLFLAMSFRMVVALERNEELHSLAAYNIRKLKVENIERQCSEALEYLEKSENKYDLVYIDPDRRSEFGRSVALEHLSPSVLELLPLIEQRADRVYIKLSPMFDIQEVLRKFQNVKRIYIIAERGEIKEVGVYVDFSISQSSSIVQMVDVATEFDYTIDFNKAILKNENTLLDPAYLHIPVALLAKCNATVYFLQSVERYAKHKDFELYYSNENVVKGFRTFSLLDRSSLAPKNIAKMLKKNGISQCNLIVKGSNKKPSDWHKSLKTRDGGEFYLLLLKGEKSEAMLARLISSVET